MLGLPNFNRGKEHLDAIELARELNIKPTPRLADHDDDDDDDDGDGGGDGEDDKANEVPFLNGKVLGKQVMQID
ncbi:hypothetical protein N9L68_07445 [bacterium]|nr:hypothetical protein [bacterium]